MTNPTVDEAVEERDLAFQNLLDAQKEHRIKVNALRLAELRLRKAVDRKRDEPTVDVAADLVTCHGCGGEPVPCPSAGCSWGNVWNGAELLDCGVCGGSGEVECDVCHGKGLV